VGIVFVALAAAGVFDGGSDASPGDGEQAETAALCIEGAEDCEDTVTAPAGGGDEVADATPPDDGDPDQPVSNDNSGTDEGEALAIEAAFAELEAMGGPPATEVDVSSVESVTWNDACLGVETPGIACAQVITPGYIVWLDSGVLAFEFHTDTSGHAVLANHPR
jgi:hypothetical protein